MNDKSAPQGLTPSVEQTDVPPVGHPLQRLGARLADLLDADDWNNVEPMLLEVWRLSTGEPVAKVHGQPDIVWQRRKTVWNWLMGDGAKVNPSGQGNWHGGSEEVAHVDELLDALAPLYASTAQMVMVPREPTFEMCKAFGGNWEGGWDKDGKPIPSFPERYRAMLAAKESQG